MKYIAILIFTWFVTAFSITAQNIDSGEAAKVKILEKHGIHLDRYSLYDNYLIIDDSCEIKNMISTHHHVVCLEDREKEYSFYTCELLKIDWKNEEIIIISAKKETYSKEFVISKERGKMSPIRETNIPTSYRINMKTNEMKAFIIK